MKALVPNWLLLNNFSFIKSCKHVIVFAAISVTLSSKGQIANYVNNPSFEIALSTATLDPYDAAKYWEAIDSTTAYCRLYSIDLNSVPYGFGGFQYPHSGRNFIGSQPYCDPTTCGYPLRWYPRNRLKAMLKPNTVYCAKYYLVNTNNNVIAIDKHGLYVGNASLDTINYCTVPLSYLTPQVENGNGIISDTLTWTAVSGTFVAVGDEKYLVLGNFRSNATTNTIVANPTFLPSKSNDILYDDVSLIEMDLPAFAGRDTFFVAGGSVFIGREPDVGLDEHCIWYQLPNMTTPIDTVAGLWVTPVTTTTYVVRQQLWCSGVKWDTVVVHQSAVGIEKVEDVSQKLKIYPVPAGDELFIEFSDPNFSKEFTKLEIVNSLGQVVQQTELNDIPRPITTGSAGTPLKGGRHTVIDTRLLRDGVYLLNLKGANSEHISTRFVISK